MTNSEKRLDRIGCEIGFRTWFRRERMFEAMSIQELRTFAVTGRWPDRPEPAPGTSRLDLMDRPSLIKLWREELEQFAGRTVDELRFYALHGRWPEMPLEALSTS